MAQSRCSVQLFLGFGSGHGLVVMDHTPASGSALSVEPAWDSLSLSVPPLLVFSLFLKIKLKKKVFFN